ncbi:MAG: FAD-dependent monooxygenase [Dermatophilaceae bacterium]
MKAIVAGAGVGGLTTALGLRSRGWDVEVVDAALRSRVSGGGLGIASNATKVLSALGVDLAASGVGRVCEHFDLRTATGRPLRELPIRSIAEELGSPVVNVRRCDLIATMRDALGDTPIRYNIRIARYDDDGTQVTVTCADGSTAAGDVLIGADGIWSAVRAQVTGPEPVNEYGYVCWIATGQFRHSRLRPGGAVHYWGNGQRFGLIDIGGGDVYWWGTKNVSARDTARLAYPKERILQSFAGWADEVREVIAATSEANILSVPAQDRPFSESWGAGRVTLVGDAAHPMLTSLSQGAGSAIEDGYAVAHHLDHADDPVTGLRDYERARRDRTRWLVSASRNLSRMEQLENPAVAWLRDFAVRHAPIAVVRRRNTAPMRFELPV